MRHFILFYYDCRSDCPENTGWLDIPMELFTSQDAVNARMEYLESNTFDDDGDLIEYEFRVREVDTISDVTCSPSLATEAIFIWVGNKLLDI